MDKSLACMVKLVKISGSMVHVYLKLILMILCHMQLFALPDNSPLSHYECCMQATLSQAFQSVFNERIIVSSIQV